MLIDWEKEWGRDQHQGKEHGVQSRFGTPYLPVISRFIFIQSFNQLHFMYYCTFSSSSIPLIQSIMHEKDEPLQFA